MVLIPLPVQQMRSKRKLRLNSSSRDNIKNTSKDTVKTRQKKTKFWVNLQKTGKFRNITNKKIFIGYEAAIQNNV